MNLYQLAAQVKPEQLKDHESKVVWKGNNGTFAYLFREDEVIFLRLSGSQFQLSFYIKHLTGWEMTSKSEYLEVVDLWQDEKADRI